MSEELEQLQSQIAWLKQELDDAHLVIGQQQVIMMKQGKMLQQIQAQSNGVVPVEEPIETS